MLLITNEWQVFFLVWILFQWELDESIHLHVLLLLLYPKLLHVLLDLKQIVDRTTICHDGQLTRTAGVATKLIAKEGKSAEEMHLKYERINVGSLRSAPISLAAITGIAFAFFCSGVSRVYHFTTKASCFFQVDTKETRVFCAIARELRRFNFTKIVSLAPEVL
ncbi:hypothetical protein Ccrd_022306 [Cynara cardunculus var. scolymus]|uniref:Uncharacterized protein n=1 Tax=Cynara cardunculus var. scolymus TaxID=59895 RepID=A0A118JZV4_CYNCS|nr:hypothetical protein Ccrd_022306 [Cynara cardunculus var. scolymus]